jgi:hypothetical protein
VILDVWRELHEQLDQFNMEAHELEERINENASKLLEERD